MCSRPVEDLLPKARSYKTNLKESQHKTYTPQKRHKSQTKGSERRRDTALVARCSENCVFAREIWFWQLKKDKSAKKSNVSVKSQWLSGKSSASQDGRMPVRVRPGHWSTEQSEEPERIRREDGGQEDPEEDGGGESESAKTEKKTSRGYASNLKFYCINTFFPLLWSSFTFFFLLLLLWDSLLCPETPLLLRRSVLQRPGRDSNRSLPHGRLWPYHWATGTSH